MAGGETSLAAAAREVQEETGVTVPAADLSQWAPTTPSAAIPAAGTSRSPCPRLLPTRLKVALRFCDPCSGHLTLAAPHSPTYTHVKGPAVRTPR
ncbi:NUDIX hydrolase [Streptomyces chrestomyceticus]|uniref:NUDIX hydrolase n=1 Tax=Streptomyces chrestomyceticus TaxID=68185 RepID=UPI0033EF90C2